MYYYGSSVMIALCRRTTSVGLPVVIYTHTQNTTQVVDSMLGNVIISPFSIIITQIHIIIHT